MNPERIVTLTFSPALDVATSVDVVTPSRKLRCEPPRAEPGGGGINVARVAQRLGGDAIAVAPLGGDRGRMVIEQLAAEGVQVEQIVVEQAIRQSFAVTEESTGRQFRFVLPPHPLDEAVARRCVETTCSLASGAACVVVSGSVDLTDPRAVLRRLVTTVSPVPVLIDTSGAALAGAIDSGAALVKPSARELSELVGRTLRTEQDITEAAVDVVADSDVRALLVSIGSGGAVLVQRDGKSIRFRAPTVEVRSTIGAGDSLVAGVAAGLARGDELIDAIRLGIAAGTATVLTEGTELCESTVVEQLLPLVTVTPAQPQAL